MSTEIFNKFRSYNGNPNLKRSGVSINWTHDIIAEYAKCSQDVVYFVETYMRIINIDRGLIEFKLYDYQKEMIMAMFDNRYTVLSTARQVGKCVSINTIVDVMINGNHSKITIGELYELSKQKLLNVSNAISIKEKELSLVRSGTSKYLEQYSAGHEEVCKQDRGQRLRDLRNLWLASSCFVWASPQTQSNHRAISSTVSETNLFGELFKEFFGDVFGREQSCIQSWGSTIPIFKELSTQGSLQSKQTRKQSGANFKRSKQSINNSGLLYQKGRGGRRSGSSIEKETNDLYSGKMHRTAWSRGRSQSLAKSTREMAEYSEIKTRGRNCTYQQTETDWYRRNIKNRKEDSRTIKEQKYSSRNTVYFIYKWEKNFCVRYKSRKQIDRVQQGLLALQSKILYARLSSQNNQKNSTRNLGFGQSEKIASERTWLSTIDNLGIGLQKKSRENITRMPQLSDTTERKFVDVVPLDNILVKTDLGYKHVKSINKTIPYQEWIIRTISGKELICADTHIFFNENMEEVYAMDLIPGLSVICTSDGPELVSFVENTFEEVDMFDLSVDSEDQRYYTNDILSHNSSVTCAFILWYILFNQDKTVALLANKGDTAREILGKIQLAYQHLPKWLQQGVVEWNKGSFELENNSRIIAAATSSDNIRGYSINMVFIDEAAFVDNWDEFFTSVYPTISSGAESKLILVSTPNGLNHFYHIWTNAQLGKNAYKPIMVHWSQVPGRDEAWKQATLSAMNFDIQKFSQEYEVEFQGSSGTLIAGWKLKQLHASIPLNERDGLSLFENSKPGHTYVSIVDVSRGKGLDYSAFSIIDVTTMPYQQVCAYRNNLMTPIDYAEIVYRIAKSYNNASVLVEINDLGEQISTSLHYDFEYENILFTENAGRSGKRISSGFGTNVDKGIRTTKTVKSVGCSILKLLIEQNQLVVHDKHTISELSTFSKKGVSYEAESGNHDDMVMGLVLFAWLSNQTFFKDITDINTLARLREKSEDEIENDLLPFGFVDHGESVNEILEKPSRGWFNSLENDFL